MNMTPKEAAELMSAFCVFGAWLGNDFPPCWNVLFDHLAKTCGEFGLPEFQDYHKELNAQLFEETRAYEKTVGRIGRV